MQSRNPTSKGAASPAAERNGELAGGRFGLLCMTESLYYMHGMTLCLDGADSLHGADQTMGQDQEAGM